MLHPVSRSWRSAAPKASPPALTSRSVGTAIYAAIYFGTVVSAAAPALPFSAAGIYDPAGPSTLLYLNGGFAQSSPSGLTPNLSGGFRLGAQTDGALALQGGLAFVTLHDIALAAGQVAQMHAYAKALLAGRGVALP